MIFSDLIYYQLIVLSREKFDIKDSKEKISPFSRQCSDTIQIVIFQLNGLNDHGILLIKKTEKNIYIYTIRDVNELYNLSYGSFIINYSSPFV